MTPFLSFLNRSTRIATRERPKRARTFRPRLETLEDRQLLSTFTVVLATDNGGPGGQMVTATTGDLRYCVEQADAKHKATSDSIGFSSALTSSPTTITLNSANGPLVLSDSYPVTIDGAGAISVSGGGQVEVFNVASGNVTMNNLAIINGLAAGGNGGGIYNNGTLVVNNCTLSNDSAAFGGGIYEAASHSVTLTNSTLSNDSATTSGGGIFVKTSGFGSTTVRLTNCTLNNNSAAAYGGGIYSQPLGSSSVYVLTNCTLNGNSAGDSGGGISWFSGVWGKLINCTLSQNSAGSSGGGIYIYYYGPNLINTIVAGNTATSSGPDISGNLQTADHVLIGDGSGCNVTNGNGNQVGGNGNPVINPMLGPLQNNGGPTQTMALLPGSPAIAAADNSMAPATDQRGFTRIDQAGEITDIGAFEVQGTMSPSAALATSVNLTPNSAASRAIGFPNSSSWFQSSVALPSVANSTEKDVAVLIPKSHASVGPTDWAHPFLASLNWLADSWDR